MRMKKLLTFLVLFCVSVGAWAATAEKLADSGNTTVTNGKGFLWNHTAYTIRTESAGDLASTLNEGTTIPDVNNSNNLLEMKAGTYFTFSGKLNAADLAALTQFGANSSNDVYFDFSDATFVDGEGNTLTDTSILKENLNNSKVKYLILPDNTTSISASDFPTNVLEAEAINPTTGQYLGYASPNGAGTLEHVIAFDSRNGKSDYNITDYTLVGTYTYQKDSNGNPKQYSSSSSTEPTYESVFSLLKNTGKDGFTNVSIEELDLSGASFPIYKDKNGNVMETEYTLSFTESSNPTIWTDKHNAMELIYLYGSSLQSVKFPTDPNTNLIPYKAFYDCSLVESYDIPGNIETIGGLAFGHYGDDSNKTALTTITFHEGLKYMNPDCFYNNQNLTAVNLPVGLTEVGRYAFTDCKALSSIVIPEGVTKLDIGCFHYTNITSIRLPNSLEVIESNAFRQCLKLTSVTIPAKVTTIGSKAFYGCEMLTDVYVLGTKYIPTCPADAFDGDAYSQHASCEEVSKGTGPSHEYGYKGYAGNPNSPVITANASTINANSWGIGKAKGAAVLHYPVANEDPEYTETTWVTYTQALEAFNTAVENSQEYQTWLSATSKTYYRDENGVKKIVTTDYIHSHPNETYYVNSRTQVWNWNYNSNYGDVYILSNGEKVIVDIADLPANWGYEADAPTYYQDTPSVQADNSDIAAIIAGEPDLGVSYPTVYLKNNGVYEEYTGTEDPGTTLYSMTKAEALDIYGEYYTDVKRNSLYGGIYAGSADDGFEITHGITKWPDGSDLYVYKQDGVQGGEGIQFPLIDGKDYSGWKNFLLAAGYDVEDETTPVVPLDNIKRDVWYTLCLPFNVSNAQLKETFGEYFELAEFTSVTVDDAKLTYTLNFTTDVEEVVKHHPYMIHPYSLAQDAEGNPVETSFTISGVSYTEEDLNAVPTEMEKVVKDGFTFVAYGHNYDNDSEVSGASPVVIPQWAYYLGQETPTSYPKFYRQTGANSRTSGGRWTKNTAVILPPSYKWGADEGYTDSRIVYDVEGNKLYFTEAADGETTSPYYNYLCEEYRLEKEVPASGDGSVKSMFINFTNEPINHDTDAIDIIASKTEAEQTIPAAYKDKIFNLNGQIVGNSADGLEKGIYIKNGKKFIVR